MAQGAVEDWARLRALWRGVKRLGAVLAMAIAIGLTTGLTLGILTICVYGLGGWIGLPVGLILGAWLGAKIAPRDAALVFVLPVLVAWIVYRVVEPHTEDGATEFAVWALAYIATSALCLTAGRHVPLSIRRPAAVVASVGFLIVASGWTVWSLWFRP